MGSSSVKHARIAFPSKTLPVALHNKYIAADADAWTSDISAIANSITKLALEKGKNAAEDKVPEIIREKQLRIRQKGPSIMPLDSNQHFSSTKSTNNGSTPSSHISYSTVAAEYFLVPLIERFWAYLRDEQTRESRTSYQGKSGYRGAGTGMILDALVLRHFLVTLAVMVHAARHSVAFLNILSPSALEIAVTIGSRPVSTITRQGNDDDGSMTIGGASASAEKENSVLSASLELALVVLDASYDLDSGRTLSLEHTSLISGTRGWTSEIFNRLDAQGGIAFDDRSAEGLNKVRRAAAGILLRIEEMLDQWRRSMIDL